MLWFFFFQAEDGIRDDLVTGVQTCALPILKILIFYVAGLINIFRCPHCRSRFKTPNGLTNHLEKKHPEQPEQIPDPCSGDGVFNYTVQCVTLSLLRLSLKEAVRAGNGAQVMAIYR